VRDVGALRRAHEVMADYLPEKQEGASPADELTPELSDFHLLSPELSRAWRGLRVWLPIKMHGIEPFRRNLDEKLDLTEWATEELKKIEGIEILAEPQLSIVAFRVARPGLDEKQRNDLSRELMSRVNGRKRIYMSGTMIKSSESSAKEGKSSEASAKEDGDRFAVRICVLSFRTHMERMREGLEDIRAVAREIVRR